MPERHRYFNRFTLEIKESLFVRRTARKEYVCIACALPIVVGEEYLYDNNYAGKMHARHGTPAAKERLENLEHEFHQRARGLQS